MFYKSLILSFFALAFLFFSSNSEAAFYTSVAKAKAACYAESAGCPVTGGNGVICYRAASGTDHCSWRSDTGKEGQCYNDEYAPNSEGECKEDSDKDGDPDESDPSPNNPNCNSSTFSVECNNPGGSSSSSGSSTGSGSSSGSSTGSSSSSSTGSSSSSTSGNGSSSSSSTTSSGSSTTSSSSTSSTSSTSSSSGSGSSGSGSSSGSTSSGITSGSSGSGSSGGAVCEDGHPPRNGSCDRPAPQVRCWDGTLRWSFNECPAWTPPDDNKPDNGSSGSSGSSSGSSTSGVDPRTDTDGDGDPDVTDPEPGNPNCSSNRFGYNCNTKPPTNTPPSSGSSSGSSGADTSSTGSSSSGSTTSSGSSSSGTTTSTGSSSSSSSTGSSSSSTGSSSGDDSSGEEGEGEEEDKGSVNGGGTCSQPPKCTGDPIACASLHQQWLTRCEALGTKVGDCETPPVCQEGTAFCAMLKQNQKLQCGDEVTKGDLVSQFEDDGLIRDNFLGDNFLGEKRTIDATADASNALSGLFPSGIGGKALGDQCISIPAIVYKGASIGFDVSSICTMLGWISSLLYLAAYLAAFSILFRAITEG